MSQIIRNRIILIQWRPWEGKTFLAVMMCSAYERIYSNVNIVDWNGKSISNYIKDIWDVGKIQYSNTKWVILLDEGGVNINARRSWSEDNRIYGELGMLWRKLNVDIIICAQLWRMVDVYFRELANYRFEMHAWFEAKDYLMFEAKIYANSWDSILKIARFDLFEFTRLTGVTYNTLENSKIESKKKEPRIPQLSDIKEHKWKGEIKNIMAPLYSGTVQEILGL